MVVRHEDVRIDAAFAMRLRPEVPEHPHPGAAIEDESGVVGRRQLEARRVSTIAPGIALKRRRRAAHSPENQLGCVVRHRWAKLHASRPAPLRAPKLLESRSWEAGARREVNYVSSFWFVRRCIRWPSIPFT